MQRAFCPLPVMMAKKEIDAIYHGFHHYRGQRYGGGKFKKLANSGNFLTPLFSRKLTNSQRFHLKPPGKPRVTQAPAPQKSSIDSATLLVTGPSCMGGILSAPGIYELGRSWPDVFLHHLPGRRISQSILFMNDGVKLPTLWMIGWLPTSGSWPSEVWKFWCAVPAWITTA